MKTQLPRLLLLGVSLAASVFAATPNTLTPEEKSAGWTLLFDGTSLAGWRGYAREAIGPGWKIVDGAIVLQGLGGDLVTRDAYGDFELSFEWKVTEAANSGVIYRVGLGEKYTFLTGPEYQVLDNAQAEDNKKHNHLAASLYDLTLAPDAKTKPVGEWNEGRVIVRGWHIEHWLNGSKVVDVDLASAEGKALLAASKFKDWPKFASLLRGHIALQDHGHEVAFRSIKLREL